MSLCELRNIAVPQVCDEYEKFCAACFAPSGYAEDQRPNESYLNIVSAKWVLLCWRIYRYFINIGMDNTDNTEAGGVPG
jgi:hypothetical protein